MLKKENSLVFGGVNVLELVERYGTPLYVTDERKLRANFRGYKTAFETAETEIYYAVKANGNLAILRILASEGAGADVFSVGELQLTKLAGVPAEKVLFNGNSKSESDLRAAVEAGVKVSVDSVDELRALSRVASEEGEGREKDEEGREKEEVGQERGVEVAVRVNPDVSPEVHPKIATGLKTSKFGVPFYEAVSVCEEARRLPGISLAGIHCHIGSQILDVSVFREAAEKMLTLVAGLHERGIELKFVDLGGGLGISHRHEVGEVAPTPRDLAGAILPVFEKTNLKLILEPGRSLVGATTILLSRVNAVGSESEIYTVVGPVCESGDIIARDRRLPKVERGDLVAILDAGAYGFSMSSQYNGRPRCAEVLVCDGEADLTRSRESVEDLVRRQEIPARLL
ncbi:diaminopimelate decarboxylase [ANME-1 cluster archaeon ex4572_4]|nr:MAG: diaminopimelate decarboxylase [ANME-1 cluster archaeon ex4572_4]